ncbi:MAG: hypothetical protein HW387_840 [Parachlamydiales bacterium]|nr:hypothetical protein [Parachlamydiales bacterium]
MKDLPHHMKKLNRRVIRSEHREMETELESSAEELIVQAIQIERPKEQLRKQFKAKMKKETLARTPTHPSDQERNQEMKHRVPIFDRLSHPRPKVGAKPKEKKPRR